MKKVGQGFIASCGLVVAAHAGFVTGAEPTKASQSVYERDIRRAITSEGLTQADLAWHALNTYGWDCEEVINRDPPMKDDSYLITCSNGKKLRVYPRRGQHPRITNVIGGSHRHSR